MTHRERRHALLVDLDGTLTDPAEGIVGSFRFACERMGVTLPAAADLRSIIGPPLRQSFAEALGRDADIEQALDHYRERYSATGFAEASVFPGVPEMLRALEDEGARLFLCTSKPIVFARRILDHFGLAQFFERAYGAEFDGRYEDKAELIGHIIAEERLDRRDCVMLGDRKHDVNGARAHGIATIGALWGFGGGQELAAAGATVLCAKPAEVPDAFAKLVRWREDERRALRNEAAR